MKRHRSPGSGRLPKPFGALSALFARLSQSLIAAVLACLTILAATVLTVGWGISYASGSTLTGASVSSAQLSAIATASRSCPMLTGARIAGHLMAESGLQASARKTASGGRGIAGLDNDAWKKWAPWPDASRGDETASIIALAHEMCDLAGQLRRGNVPGDEWQLSLAAFHSGMASVVKAGGVPDADSTYVSQASGYAAYYATLSYFGGSKTPGSVPAPATSTATAVPLPNEDVAAVVAAGSMCRQVTPPVVAGLLMTVSGFDPNRLGANGERGVAQFRDDIWERYAPSGASAWDTAAAVPTVGKALCGLITELSGLRGGDPYLLALSAYRNGVDAVRQSGGVPDVVTQAFLSTDAAYVDYYKLDTRLTAPKPGASPSASPSASGSPKPSGSPSVSSSVAPAATQVASDQPPVIAPTGGATSVFGPYFIYNNATKLCFDLPGVGPGAPYGIVDQYDCHPNEADNQEFEFVPRRIDGNGNQLYWIRNTTDSLCVDLEGSGAVSQDSPLQESTCLDNDNQYFRLVPKFTADGRQYYQLHESLTDFCVDVPGIKVTTRNLQLTIAICQDNDDHEWALIPRSKF